jgi:hypothetical protein
VSRSPIKRFAQPLLDRIDRSCRRWNQPGEGPPLSNVIPYPPSISQFSHGSASLDHLPEGPHDYNGAAINFGNMRPNRSSRQGPFPGCLRVIKGAIQSDHAGRSRHRVKFCIGLLQLMFPVDERAQSGKEVPKVNCSLAIED